MYMYLVTRNLETQTDRQTPAGAPSCIQRVQVYLREAGTHTHTHIKRHSHDTTACRAQHTCSYIHTYMHITNSPNPSCSPPAVCFAQSKHSAARSQVAGMTSGKISLSSVWWNPATTALVSSFFPFVTFPCNSLLLLPKSYITWSG
jgi:hypothetical protein